MGAESWTVLSATNALIFHICSAELKGLPEFILKSLRLCVKICGIRKEKLFFHRKQVDKGAVFSYN